MKSKIILSPFVICLICLITNPNLFAQKNNLTPGSPEWLVDMFFNQNRFDEKADYYAGEMLNEVDQPTIGEELSGSAFVSSRVLVSNDNEFVFAVEVKVEDEAIVFYSYIIKTTDGWKINAIRRFLLPKFVYSVVDSLSTLTNLSADDSSLFIPLKFLTMNDIQLKAFLTEHSDELYDLAWFFKHEEDANIEASLSSLGCSGIFMDEKYSGCVFIQASSFEMMEVGFINAGADSVLPEISPYDFVYIENVLPGWYVYRLM